MRNGRSRVAAVAAGALVVVGLGAGGATAADMVGSPEIRDNSVKARDIYRNSIRSSELAPDAVRRNHVMEGAIGWQNLRPVIVDRILASAEDGNNGSDGKSAYEIAVDHGFSGTEEEWLASLVGPMGEQGEKGDQGVPGEDGNALVPSFTVNGDGHLIAQWDDQEPVDVGRVTGVAGLSAYEIATRHGFEGTETEWLASLKGEQGERGPLGFSAYEVAKREGFTGTREAWLASLKGERGDVGPQGPKGADGVANLEADGPYPGAGIPPLQDHEGQGAQSTALWTNDGLQTSWVMCPEGKSAMGGGFSAGADDTRAAKESVQIVSSEPAQYRATKSGFEPVYEPIEGDAAGSFLPNAWVVQGFYTGEGDTVVRPWVTCVEVGTD
jgi:hypothetical protein